MLSRPKILFLVSLVFVALLNSIPTYLLTFNFLNILVCLLFIHAKHSYNLSAGAQNVTGTYVITSKMYLPYCAGWGVSHTIAPSALSRVPYNRAFGALTCCIRTLLRQYARYKKFTN